MIRWVFLVLLVAGCAPKESMHDKYVKAVEASLRAEFAAPKPAASDSKKF